MIPELVYRVGQTAQTQINVAQSLFGAGPLPSFLSAFV